MDRVLCFFMLHCLARDASELPTKQSAKRNFKKALTTLSQGRNLTLSDDDT